MIDLTGYRCQMGNSSGQCPQPATTALSFGEFSVMSLFLCDRHKPTVEQALRRGIVATHWKVHGYYPNEIARTLSGITGHAIRESTVRADLRWLGLTEAHRAADARLDMAVRHGEAGPNVVALRRAR